ncbi:MAG: VWA domain-containing protein [Thermacetogeniaceae bacterium]
MPNYLEYNLARFVNILRYLGVNVSTGETINALEALSLIDIMNREHAKIALQASMIKNHDDQGIFDRAFNSFFAAPEIKSQQQQSWEEGKEDRARLIEEAEQELSYLGDKLELTPEEKLLFAQLDEKRKKKIRDYLDSSHLPEDRSHAFKPILESHVRRSLHYWRQRLAEEGDLPFVPADGLDDAVLAAISQDMGYEDSSLLYQDMKRIGDRDLPKVTNILKKLSRKLATKISRRYRMSKKATKIDLRRSIKANIRYGGIIFKLKYKQKRIQKPKILLICDVSASMARYATFVIQFIYGLSAVIRQIESFIFAEELEYVTPYFRRIRPFEETMVELIGKSRIWGKGTNFGVSLNVLKSRFPLLLTSHTVIIVVSDTKTLDIQRSERELAVIRRSVKDVLWLNTLPVDEWKDLRSVSIFQRYSRMYECYTLAHLDKIIRKQFCSKNISLRWP